MLIPIGIEGLFFLRIIMGFPFALNTTALNTLEADIIPEEHRLQMVAALKPVDHAILGDKTDMFNPIKEIRPSVITIGFNQHFDEIKLHQQLIERGMSPEIVRIGKYAEEDLCSSRFVVQRIIEVRGKRDEMQG